MSLLDRTHYRDNILDKMAELERRINTLERAMPGRAGEASDRLAYYRPADGSMRAPTFLTITEQNAARATRTAAQTIANATWTVVQYNTEDYDNQGEWDTTNYRFTVARVGGLFLVCAAILYDDTDTFTDNESARLALYVNGSAYCILDRKEQLDAATTTHYVQLNGCSVVELPDVGDYVDVRTYQDSGGNLDLLASPSIPTHWVTIHRLS